MTCISLDYRMRPSLPACVTLIAICLVIGAGISSGTSDAVASEKVPERINLAWKKPARSSSIENEDQSAAKANDGDDDTHWCADDEPDTGAEWWQVDLQKPADLSSCEITWPYDGKQYRYKVEGSTDGKNWAMLSDQTKTTATSRVQNLKLAKAIGIRFVKITIISFDQGCWASIAEVKVFASEQVTEKK